MGTVRWAAAIFAVIVGLATSGAQAAPYAALVMDARTGEVLHARSADRRLHPASLTKMMTLYLTFEAVRAGKVKLDQRVRVSRHASRQVPSKMGLRRGQRVSIRDLIRVTAVKSANDAAVALAEAVGGSERDFARLMTVRARELGMKNTTFRNASGLTARGQLSTARDMAVLGRALFYDFPQYYNLFGRKTTTAMGRKIYNTNRRLLAAYRGADGIKTGYTNAAGYNLVSSAERGKKRIIAVVFGGRSGRWRNARVAELLDMGFKRAPENAVVRRHETILVKRSPAPLPRPGGEATPSLLAQAGGILSPAAAHAATNPIVYSEYSPRNSPVPRARPGTETAASATVASSAKAPTSASTAGDIVKPKPRPQFARTAADLRDAETWAVQLGVFANEETAVAELASAALSDIDGLKEAGREIRETRLSGEAVYRARLTGFDRTGARAACNALKSRGQPCLPVASPQS